VRGIVVLSFGLGLLMVCDLPTSDIKASLNPVLDASFNRGGHVADETKINCLGLDGRTYVYKFQEKRI
jgi:hypothetical protein